MVALIVLMLTRCSSGVPASPSDKLWEEIGNVKTMMAAVSDELEKFNTLYLGKLEYRMLSMASTLSSLDSNVKNLQERAHVWDTFQLHVAAWNDQMSTLDKKVDILSSSDLETSNYHIFGSIKKQLRGQHYETLEDIRKAVRQCLREDETKFYSKGIFKLTERREKCMQRNGDYVEK
ncbi:hypothetical protein ANN_02954 [Periplaneta americana]|uniref:Uncharacterized protein n=1 Tax=Periplaneta americana TaxID=6978 RepID=A0ABQ8TZC8_PERAM|nr:hypothetical protein ANN_02954 [Periplaneta americana]